MLPYALAIAVGLSSSFLFFTAFFFKDIHRPDDFFWSTIGLFYALVLWFCATSITGAVLLGQLTAVALLLAYVWQTIKLRDALANPEKQANLDSFSVVAFLKQRLLRSPVLVKPTPESATTEPQTDTATTATPEVTPATQVETAIKEPETITEKPTPTPNETEIIKAPETSVVPIEKETAVVEVTDSVPENPVAEVEDVEEVTKSDLQSEAEEDAETVSNTEEVVEVDTEVVSSPPETITTTEITVEKVTIVEEETNWDDEVEDIPDTSVKVIEETLETNSETEKSAETKKSDLESD